MCSELIQKSGKIMTLLARGRLPPLVVMATAASLRDSELWGPPLHGDIC